VSGPPNVSGPPVCQGPPMCQVPQCARPLNVAILLSYPASCFAMTCVRESLSRPLVITSDAGTNGSGDWDLRRADVGGERFNCHLRICSDYFLGGGAANSPRSLCTDLRVSTTHSKYGDNYWRYLFNPSPKGFKT
jgi:hypothetical protein